MAGNYPDPPGIRLALDKDGTLAFRRSANDFNAAGTAAPASDLKNVVDDDINTYAYGNSSVSSSGAMFWIFPSLRDISHVHCSWYAGVTFEWSPNTTNGIDGTWNALAVTNQPNTREAQRENIQATPTMLGVKAIRYRSGGGGARTYSLHLYGKPTDTSNRLEFWHPTLDQPLRDTPGFLDWGDRPRSSSATKQVRVKNTSAGLTASSITISNEELVASSPTLASQHQVRYAGGSYGATATIASLAPGAISDLIEVKQDLLENAAVGLFTIRLAAEAGSWS